MKNIKSICVLSICIAICFLFQSCGTTSSASKNSSGNYNKVKHKNFMVEYPEGWKRFGLHGYVYLRPKTYNKNPVNIELNNISFIYKTLDLVSQDNYLDSIEKHAKQLTIYQKKRTFNIVKLNEESKFLYRVDSYIVYTNHEGVYRRKDYFYTTKDGLTYISAQFEKELFDAYEKDIDFIISSFEIRRDHL